ncbi:MAG: phosphate ABC transporter substrate-binding protein PstS [Thermoleophilia bacterium]|nr:phosphate ABC transporter substrate-binding protein PstS [Thermoleophilia bacterium]
MNRTLRNSLATAVIGGATLALPALALGTATGSGASFPATAYTKWCQDSGLCSYTSKGSTGGINDLINGVVDFAATDAPLTSTQLSDLASKRGGATPLYFPTLIGAVTVPTNIDGVSKGINIKGPVLADIFRGAITSWNDAKIRASNPGVRFPSAPITICVRSDGSGTSFGFTSYLSKVNTAFRNSVTASQTPNWPTSGVTVVKGPRNPGVASCIKANKNSIGYVDISDARDAGLTKFFAKIGKTEVVKGKRTTVYVLPSAGSALKAANLTKFKSDLTLSLTASPAKGAYPIAITTWLVAYSNYGAAGKSATARDDVKKVLNYAYSSAAQGALKDLRFAPLPAGLITVAKAQISKIK